MAVIDRIPNTLAQLTDTKATAALANTWIEENSDWLNKVLDMHDAWVDKAQIGKYQAAYDGRLESIETRDKTKNGDTVNNKIIANYAQVVIDTIVDYLLGKAPVWNVEDQQQEDKETKETDIVKNYRKALKRVLKNSQRVLAEQLRQGSIAGYSVVIAWVNEKGSIDYDEFPVQEAITIFDARGRLVMLVRKYQVASEDRETKALTKVEVYDERYISYYQKTETGNAFELDPDQEEGGNPIEHKAGRVPCSVFINGTPASYEDRTNRAGMSDIGNAVFTLIEAYAAGISDKANLVDYLQDQYLLLKGVDTTENEVLKMRRARAIALKSSESDASFIAQNQEDKTIENYLDRIEKAIYETTFTPKLSDLQGATATEIKMKYASLDIKAGKKEMYFLEAIEQFIRVITDLLNAEILIDNGTESPYEVLSDEAALEERDDLYNADWVTCKLNRNLPQNYKELADIVAELIDKVPDKYLYELLWFIDDPKKALEEMKAQKDETATRTAQANLTAMGLGGEFGDTGTGGGTGE